MNSELFLRLLIEHFQKRGANENELNWVKMMGGEMLWQLVKKIEMKSEDIPMIMVAFSYCFFSGKTIGVLDPKLIDSFIMGEVSKLDLYLKKYWGL